MPNQPGNGRNVTVPDENRPSWRAEDDSITARTRRNLSEDDERWRDEERAIQRDRERYGSHWEDRTSRDRDDYRATEPYAPGPRGYTAGRYEDERSQRYPSRGQNYPGSFEERTRERGLDDRYGGRGSSGTYGVYGDSARYSVGGHNLERYGTPGSYGYGGGRSEYGGYSHEAERMGTGGYLGQGGQQMGYQGQPGLLHAGSQGSYERPTYGNEPPSRHLHRYGVHGLGGHRGKGPVGWTRSDERIKEIVCEALTDDDQVDATHVEVTVKNGEVTLSGTVDDRLQKRMAEECIENLSGVKDVQNLLRVGPDKSSTELGRDTRHQA